MFQESPIMYAKNARRSPSLLCPIIVFALMLIVPGGLGQVHADDPVLAPPGLAVEPTLPHFSSLGAADQQAWEWEVVRLVNTERARPENGNLPPLKFTAGLRSAARAHSQDMGTDDYFDHNSYNYNGGSWTFSQSWSGRILAYYTGGALGENIAAGYSSPAQVMSSWMASAGHRYNILSSNFTEIGVGYYYDAGDSSNVYVPSLNPADQHGNGPYYHYWVQDFGQRSDVYPVVINSEVYSTTSRTVQLYVYGPGCGQMRFSNDNIHWSSWETFCTDKTWLLAEGVSGIRTVYVQVKDGSQTYSASDDIYYVSTDPVLSVSPTKVTFVTEQGTGTCHPTEHTIRVSNAGGGTLDWDASESSDWFAIAKGAQTVTITCVPTVVENYGTGEQSDSLAITDPTAQNNPQNVPVTLVVAPEIYTISFPLVMYNSKSP